MKFELSVGVVSSEPARYAVPFEVKRDRRRGEWVLPRIQSAFVLEKPAKRHRNAMKMKFQAPLKQLYKK